LQTQEKNTEETGGAREEKRFFSRVQEHWKTNRKGSDERPILYMIATTIKMGSEEEFTP